MVRVDFTSQDYLRDPATGLAKIRAAGSVVEVRFPIVGKTWITTTSDLAGRVLKDSETFRMRKDGKVAGLRWWMPGWLRALAVSMLTMDEPDHTRLRTIVNEAFRRRAVLDAAAVGRRRAQRDVARRRAPRGPAARAQSP